MVKLLNIILLCQGTIASFISQPPSISKYHGAISGSTIRSRLYDVGWYGAYPQREFVTVEGRAVRPSLTKVDDRCDNGHMFIAPRGELVDMPGPMLLDAEGEIVWMELFWGKATDFRVQMYMGKPYITFWHGEDGWKSGNGSYVILDDSYRLVREIRPVGTLSGDFHEFELTNNNTALFTIYQQKEADLSAFGIPNGRILDSIFQEVDLSTGELVFEWRASEHIKVEESMVKPSPGDLPFDFFHIDSVQRGPDNDYLVSAHHLDTVLSVSQADGSIRWRLGGAKNDFADLSGGAATQFRRNHHAKWSSDGIITLFDQGSHSAKMLAVDVSTRTAMLVQEYKAPEHMALSASRGSVQVLDSGNVLVGWGTVPVVTEYSAEGELLCDTRFGPLRSGWVQNYRAYKFPWKGRPQTVPDVVVDDADAEEQDAVYVSWNGATDVIAWKLESASWTGSKWTGYQLHEVIGSEGFETRVKLPVSAGPMIRVTALGEGGSVLGWSKDILLRNRAPALIMERKRRTAIKGIVCCTLVSTGALALAVSTIWKMIKKRRARLGMTGHRYMPLYSAKKGDA